MRRVDHHEMPQQFRSLGCQIPGNSTAPVVSDQRLHAATGLLVDQSSDVCHEMLGSIGFHLLRRRGAAKATQVRSDAAVAFAEMLEQLIPDERSLREAMKKNKDRLPRRSRRPTLQCDAVRQD